MFFSVFLENPKIRNKIRKTEKNIGTENQKKKISLVGIAVKCFWVVWDGVRKKKEALSIRASQFFQIAMLIRGIVVGVKWVSCSQILLAQAYIWSSPKHFCLM